MEANSFFATLLNLWEDEQLCDVQLRTANGALVPGHKMVLASASSFFLALFTGAGQEMAEAGSNVIDLPGIDEQELRLLLKCVYGGNVVIHVTLENAPLLLEAATYLSVESVISACCRLLYQNLDLESVVETLVVSDRCQCTSLRDDAVSRLNNFSHYCCKTKYRQVHCITLQMRYLLGHFVPLIQSSSSTTIQRLPDFLFKEIIQSDCLDVAQESDVVFASVIWALGEEGMEHDRIGFLNEMLPISLRGPHSWVGYKQAVEDAVTLCHQSFIPEERFVEKPSHNHNALLQDLMTSLRLLCSRESSVTDGASVAQSHPRQGSPTMLLAAGGVDSGWRGLKLSEFYDPRTDAWAAGPNLPFSLSLAGACTIGSNAYLVEGAAHLPTVLTYDRRSKKECWERVPRLLIARVNMAVVGLPWGMYVVGGRAGTGLAGTALCSSEVYLPLERRWQEIAPMVSPRASLGAASLDSKVYALGGQSDRVTHASMECFEVGRNAWVKCHGEMKIARKYFSACASNGRILAAGGVTATRQRLTLLEAWDPREGKWQELPPLPFARSSFGMAAVGNEIFVVGGSAEEGGACAAVHAFSMTSGTWRSCASLSIPRSGLALTTL